MAEPLITVENLSVRFSGRDKTVHAVNGVGFSLARGRVLSLLGESGSGKSVTLRALMRLHDPKRTVIGGRVIVDGRDVLALDEPAIRDYRGRVAAMIFQEPMLAFDPVFTIGRQIEEAILAHERVDRAEARRRTLELFERVRIPSPARRLDSYPHEMSGGMRQRAMIALALAGRPKLLLADEPTTALDATVQIQILLLLRELQQELGMSVIFVTHDIGVAAEIGDELGVMYAGRLVESGPIGAVIRSPRHPYTEALLGATVRPGMRGRRLVSIPGAPPALASAPTGCGFAPRCVRVGPECRETMPQPVADGDRTTACLRVWTADGSARPHPPPALTPSPLPHR